MWVCTYMHQMNYLLLQPYPFIDSNKISNYITLIVNKMHIIITVKSFFTIRRSFAIRHKQLNFLSFLPFPPHLSLPCADLLHPREFCLQISILFFESVSLIYYQTVVSFFCPALIVTVFAKNGYFNASVFKVLLKIVGLDSQLAIQLS